MAKKKKESKLICSCGKELKVSETKKHGVIKELDGSSSIQVDIYDLECECGKIENYKYVTPRA